MDEQRKINLSTKDGGDVALEVVDGAEAQSALLVVKGGSANPVQCTVTADAVSIQFTIDGKISFITATRKDGKIVA